MGFFKLHRDLAIDLGTANTVIFCDGKIVLDEPSIVAMDVKTGKVIAIGNEAKVMDGKVNPSIETICPLSDGALLRGIARRFSEKVNIDFHVADDPLKAVARGTCDALQHIGEYKFLIR